MRSLAIGLFNLVQLADGGLRASVKLLSNQSPDILMVRPASPLEDTHVCER